MGLATEFGYPVAVLIAFAIAAGWTATVSAFVLSFAFILDGIGWIHDRWITRR